MTKHYQIDTFSDDISNDGDSCDRLTVNFIVKNDNIEIEKIYNNDTKQVLDYEQLSDKIRNEIFDTCSGYLLRRGL